MILILAVFLGVICLASVRRLRLKYLSEKYGYQLFALRDELRELVLKGHVDPNNWLFAYLDSTIVKSIDNLRTLSVPRLIFLQYEYRNDPRLHRSIKQLSNSISKPDNSPFLMIHLKLYSILGTFVLDRHLHARNLVSSISFIEVRWRKLHQRFETALESPEASTLEDFCPQG